MNLINYSQNVDNFTCLPAHCAEYYNYAVAHGVSVVYEINLYFYVGYALVFGFLTIMLIALSKSKVSFKHQRVFMIVGLIVHLALIILHGLLIVQYSW